MSIQLKVGFFLALPLMLACGVTIWVGVAQTGKALQAQEAALRGHTRVQEMVEARGEINQAGQNISKTIDEIAFQTNLRTRTTWG